MPRPLIRIQILSYLSKYFDLTKFLHFTDFTLTYNYPWRPIDFTDFTFNLFTADSLINFCVEVLNIFILQVSPCLVLLTESFDVRTRSVVSVLLAWWDMPVWVLGFVVDFIDLVVDLFV